MGYSGDMSTKNWTSEVPDTSGMTDPVRCTISGDVYDLDNVDVTHDPDSGRSMWRSPCCNTLVMEGAAEPSGARSLKNYVRLARS
jgi:hypothetical protein